MTMQSKKALFKKIVSFLVVVCMVSGVMLQMMPVHVHAAAPTTYSTITADTSASVSITTSGGVAYFQFVPRATGTYKFYSSNNGSNDPVGALLNSAGNTIIRNDDSSGYNFSITYECLAGTTYYIQAYLYSGTGSYTLNVQTVSITEIPCEHEWVTKSETAATCTTEGAVTKECSLCGETEETAVPKLGHDYDEGYCTRCGAAEPQADVWDGTVDTSWYVSGQTEFTLYTAEQLAGLAYLTNNGVTFGGVTINLGNNIDLAGLEWTPIGLENKTFGGVFNGNDYIVKNVKMYQLSDYSGGLFGWINGATVKNLGVEDIDYIISTLSRVGGLVGVMEYSTVENCYTTGRMELTYSTTSGGNFGIGGLIGDMRTSATIKNCYASCDMINKITYQYAFVSGLVGFICVNGDKTISNCYTDSRITTNGASFVGIGGIVGYAYYGTLIIENSFSGVTIDDTYGKSIVGYRDTSSLSLTLRNTYYPVGGTGYTGASATETENFRSQAWIESNLGWNFADMWEFKSSSEYPVLQGFDGIPSCDHEFEETSRTEATCTADGVIVNTCSKCGATEEEIIPMLEHSYEEGYCTGCGAAEPRADVWDGTVDTSWYVSGQTEFTLYTAEELAGLAYLVNNGTTFRGVTIYLGSDIDLDGREWTPIGKGISTSESYTSTYSFYGTFDGNHNIVYNLSITSSSTSFTGFFGCLYGGTVLNLGIENASVTATGIGTYRCTAGILAGASGNGVTVSNCYVTGQLTVNGNSSYLDIGCIIGDCYDAQISDSYAVASITVNSGKDGHVGGLFGFYAGGSSATRCFYYGNITVASGASYIGAIASNGGSGTLSYCYYNSNKTTSSATYIADENLLNESYFSGFDFTDVWEMGTEYPILQGFDGIPSCEHEFEETSRTEATCTEDGVIVNTCSKCGATREEAIPMTGHSFEETSRTEATCTADGVIISTCPSCGATEEEVIPMIEHSYEEGYCTGCGAAEPQADVWDGTADTSWYVSGRTEFTLYTAEELAGLAYLVNNGTTFSGVTIYLGSDIDLDGREWTPIGTGSTSSGSDFTTRAFSGTFNGNGHTIIGLSINNTSLKRAGFFGALNGATVTMLKIKDANVTITQRNVISGGVIAGTANNSAITKCEVSGNVSVTDNSTSSPHCAAAGLLVGYAGDSVTIDSCAANGSVEGKMPYAWNAYVGGIIGAVSANEGGSTVSNTYFCGRVYAYGYETGYAGGIIGSVKNSSIINCFVVADITSSDHADAIASSVSGARPSTSNSYYSSSTASSFATATDAANFKSQAWLSATLGWDFADVWTFTAGSEYPVLQGFGNAGGMGGDEEESDRHTHDFVETSRTESTCTEYGEIVYTCECGSTTTVLIQPKQHSYQVTGTVDATCTENGYIEFVCENEGCSATKRQVLEALGHDYGSDHICDRCGHTVDLHMHEYSVVTVEPTCTTMGYKEYTCHCGYSYKTSFVEPTRHNWNDGEVTVEASCTAEGVITYTCHDCGATKTTVIPSGHSWSEAVTVNKTCTQDGSITKTCDVCGATETEVIPAGHDWDDGTVTVEPTCKTEGTKSCTCHDCGATEEVAIPALGHEYFNGTCRRCGGKFIEDITPTNRPLYGMYFEIDDILSDYGPSLIDEYGLMLDYNSDATIEKVAVYLTQEGNMWRRCIAVKGTNIEYATYVPYLSYEGEIKYSGLNHDWINIFRLSENSDGIWCYNNYATIGVNLEDAYGNLLLSMYDIGQAGAETKIFDNLGDMIAWLNEDKCDHTPGEWIVDTEPTATQTGRRHKECTYCHATVATEVMPVLATLVIDSVRAEAGKTVRVTIDIQNNPGIIGAVLTLNYNSALTLVNVEAGSAWNSLNFTRPSSFAGPCNFVWDGVEGADFSDGTIIVLTFEVPEGADEGDVYEITASYTYGNMINADLEKVNVEIEGGFVTVDNSIGDVNDDGVVDVADVITLRRYLAGGYGVTIDESASDMDDDGYITVADVVLLRRLLVAA